MENKSHVPNHQPDIPGAYLLKGFFFAADQGVQDATWCDMRPRAPTYGKANAINPRLDTNLAKNWAG